MVSPAPDQPLMFRIGAPLIYFRLLRSKLFLSSALGGGKEGRLDIQSLVRIATGAALSGLLVFGAVGDVKDRIISNRLVLVIFALWIPWVFCSGAGALVSGAAAASIGLAVGFLLFGLGVIGGGDAKYFAVAALYVGLSRLLEYACVVGILGGLMALFYLVSKPRALIGFVLYRTPLAKDRGVPYGVPISAGLLLLLWGGWGAAIIPIQAIFHA